MRRLEADYLVVGAGASGLAFVDSLLSLSTAEVVLVDRRPAPGGHWVDAYPFVRLHQPSAYYGVGSRVLGQDRVDETGPNAGFYERATGDQVREYFKEVLREQFEPSGRVSFLGHHEYRGQDSEGHHLVSLLTGEESVVKVRARLVDATYIQSEIPSRRAPPYEVDPGARVIPPNRLVALEQPAAAFTVIGAGKTAMDTCGWLLEMGVDPDRITWVKTRESWLFDRAFTQPLDLVSSFMRMQAHWVQAAAAADSGDGFAHALEDRGVFVRVDPAHEGRIFRGATISRREVEALRAIGRVVRLGRVQRVAARRLVLEGGDVPTGPREVHVDCTAAGVPAAPARAVFGPGRITLQYVTVGVAPWSAATIAAVEALEAPDEEKNRLCPPVEFSGESADLLALVRSGLLGQVARARQPEVAAWNDACRLNPVRGFTARLGDPELAGAVADLLSSVGAALRNLAGAVPGR